MHKIDWSLYAIIDTDFLFGRPVEQIAEQMIAGGVTVLQLRNKSGNIREFYTQAQKVRPVANTAGVPLLVNDRLDVAIASGADGVHLGQSDLPVGPARKLLGKDGIIGISIHNMTEFGRCDLNSASYLGVGTIYPTGSKPGLSAAGPAILQRLRPQTSKPLIAIGGITPDNLREVFQAGGDGVAVISALMGAHDIKKKAAEFRHKIREARTVATQ